MSWKYDEERLLDHFAMFMLWVTMTFVVCGSIIFAAMVVLES